MINNRNIWNVTKQVFDILKVQCNKKIIIIDLICLKHFKLFHNLSNNKKKIIIDLTNTFYG